MGNLLCMGLFLLFQLVPHPRSAHVANDGLSPSMDVNVLDGHFQSELVVRDHIRTPLCWREVIQNKDRHFA